jgi:hypothetical protein
LETITNMDLKPQKNLNRRFLKFITDVEQETAAHYVDDDLKFVHHLPPRNAQNAAIDSILMDTLLLKPHLSQNDDKVNNPRHRIAV